MLRDTPRDGEGTCSESAEAAGGVLKSEEPAPSRLSCCVGELLKLTPAQKEASSAARAPRRFRSMRRALASGFLGEKLLPPCTSKVNLQTLIDLRRSQLSLWNIFWSHRASSPCENWHRKLWGRVRRTSARWRDDFLRASSSGARRTEIRRPFF